ncbi:MAG: RNA polymerase sporulation sigma factor SigK [Clostridia bacterium]
MFTELLSLLSKLFCMTGYYANASYPTPLPPEEEQKALVEAKAGSKQARDRLITHNLRLVAHICKKYSQNNDIDELISIGSIGLIKGIESFDADKGATLATYLARCIENEILMVIRANKRYKNTVYLQEQLGVDNDGNEYTLMDILADKEDSVFHQAELNILREKLFEIMKVTLNSREYEIIVLRFGLSNAPLTQLETAQKLGISRSYISRIETKALKKIREKLNDDDF